MENSGVELSVTLRPLDCTRTGSEDIETTEQSITTPHKLFKGSFFKFFLEPDEEVFDLEWLMTSK